MHSETIEFVGAILILVVLVIAIVVVATPVYIITLLLQVLNISFKLIH